jgi:serine/threonine protein kinase
MESLTAADPRTVGEFRLRARLGAGGMGQVFLATSLGGRIVAVKVIHTELASDSEFVRRFRAEVDAAKRVSGMYTAPVVAAGVDDRPPWLATAFVPGPSLDRVISKHGPLPSPALWRLAAGLAEALRAIHSVGLVHRDLKPANVLLASDGPRVIDFGISRAASDSNTRLTATGSIIGTPSFMSPEQVEAKDTGPASDVFSLGSVLAYAAS